MIYHVKNFWVFPQSSRNKAVKYL